MSRLKSLRAVLLASPDDVEAQFYEAIQHADIDKLMMLWSDDDDIACVPPGGPRLMGAAAIRAGFEAVFANGPVPLQLHGIKRLHSMGSAVHHVVESIALQTDEGVQRAWLLATNVYLKTALGWRMVAHHVSQGSAEAAEAEAERDAPSTLH
jgi:ketosteroid isomerase-like protein